MARDEGKMLVEANIENSVDAVVKRVIGERRSVVKKYRLKSGSVAEVGLEDEKDDSSGTSVESVEFPGNVRYGLFSFWYEVR